MSVPRWTLVLTIAAALLGAIHLALTPLAYSSWTLDALWFVGTGLAMLMPAAANAVGTASPTVRGAHMMVVINLAMTGFFAAAWSVLPGLQVIVGGVVFMGLAYCNWPRRHDRQSA